MSKFRQLFSSLDKTVQLFIKEVNEQKLTNIAAGSWSTKEVLCHIVFWHRYYAQQYSALARGKKPLVFTSRNGSTRNKEGVNTLKHMSKKDLIKMLNKAHNNLYQAIVIKNVPEMSYTDHRKYKTDEFLKVINGHIKRHTIQIRRAKEVPDKTR